LRNLPLVAGARVLFNRLPPETLKALITIDGGEPIDHNW